MGAGGQQTAKAMKGGNQRVCVLADKLVCLDFSVTRYACLPTHTHTHTRLHTLFWQPLCEVTSLVRLYVNSNAVAVIPASISSLSKLVSPFCSRSCAFHGFVAWLVSPAHVHRHRKLAPSLTHSLTHSLTRNVARLFCASPTTESRTCRHRWVICQRYRCTASMP